MNKIHAQGEKDTQNHPQGEKDPGHPPKKVTSRLRPLRRVLFGVLFFSNRRNVAQPPARASDLPRGPGNRPMDCPCAACRVAKVSVGDFVGNQRETTHFGRPPNMCRLSANSASENRMCRFGPATPATLNRFQPFGASILHAHTHRTQHKPKHKYRQTHARTHARTHFCYVMQALLAVC